MVFFTIFIIYFKDIFFILYLSVLVLLSNISFIKVYVLYNYYFIVRGNLNAVEIS